MKIKKAIISFVVIILLCLPFTYHVLAYGEYTISSYQVDIVVDKSAVFDVVETISIEDCDTLTFQKAIMQTYSYDIDGDGVSENYTYGISDVSVQGASYSSHEENGKLNLDIQLENPTQQLMIKYKVRMRNFDESDKTTLLFNVLDPSMAGTIEKFQMKMQFPNQIDGQIEAYDIDRSGSKGQSIQNQINDKTLTITSSKSIDPSMGIMLHGTFRKFYFTYSNAFSFHLFFSIASILFVMASYFLIVFYPKMRKKKALVECYPIENLRMGTLGYIMDGACDERDIMSLIIEWANQNYIQIRDENQTVSLIIVNELPLQAPQYEKHLFNLIFDEYTMVTVDQLRFRRLAERMYEVEEEIYQAQVEDTTNIVYTSTSFLYQVLYSLFVCIPLGLTLFVCQYEISYSFIMSFVHGMIASVFVFLNCLPWIWIVKHRYSLNKSSFDVYRILTGLMNLVCGAIIHSYMLQNQTPMVYAVIAIILTILEACIMIFMDKQTYYGRTIRARILSLRHFICRAQVKQLESLLFDNSYYFEDMLPYAYYFDIADMWGKKFTAIQLQAPFWYFHANANANSTIYWMSALDKSLKQIQESLMSKPIKDILKGRKKSKKNSFKGK